ncbi:hypothetical protein [Moorena sp. SIO3H5]|uniref:hypothetical protein n=1 Tax=Moorena sp. SIO3H5 TaxID=2607834 RepID=UPI0025DC0F4C|nr:hypothetical protein [Moorena sp. SIO3H5]
MALLNNGMILRVLWNGHLARSGSLWNGHLGGTGILVELASCQFPPYFRAGRMPTLLLFKRRFSNAANSGSTSDVSELKPSSPVTP